MKCCKVHLDMLQTLQPSAIDGDEWSVSRSGRFILGESASYSFCIRGWADYTVSLHGESSHSSWTRNAARKAVSTAQYRSHTWMLPEQRYRLSLVREAFWTPAVTDRISISITIRRLTVKQFRIAGFWTVFMSGILHK
jgi:hypothetical protein